MKPVYLRADGTYEIEHQNGGRYHATADTAITIEMVEVYLAEHPEALQPEPAPPAPTPEELIRRELAEKLAYLQSTDWYVVRYAETGTAIPEDVIAARAAARTRIDELKGATV